MSYLECEMSGPTHLPAVLTIGEAAAYLSATPSMVTTEIIEGRLAGFQIGGEWRTTDAALLSFVSGQVMLPQAPTPASREDVPHKLAQDLSWSPSAEFEMNWPAYAGKENREHYSEAWEARLDTGSGACRLLIGLCDRHAAGMFRRRAVVFSAARRALTPLTEFAGANDFEVTGLMASVIKTRDGKHVVHRTELPPAYGTLDVRPYNSIVRGPYASKALAVVAKADDHQVMAVHALVRMGQRSPI